VNSSSKDQYPKVYLYRRIVQAKLFIDRHFAEKIDLTNIAEEATFSKFHFIRLFKKVYGKPPHQYLISVRVEKAKASAPLPGCSSGKQAFLLPRTISSSASGSNKRASYR